MSEDNSALLSMAIEHAKTLERVLQITENLEQRQDDMKQGMDYMLKVINGNGDGRVGLKTAAAIHDSELTQIKKELEDIKKQRVEDTALLTTAKDFFEDRKKINFGWKQFAMVGLLQTILILGITLGAQRVVSPNSDSHLPHVSVPALTH